MTEVKKTLCVVTGTRAEYGLLRTLIGHLYKDEDIEMRLTVTGAHLSAAFGDTVGEIECDGYPIHAKIPMALDTDTHAGMARATGLAMVAFSDYFEQNRPDMLIVLGDRYEIFAAATAAAMQGIPIAHIGGGDTSEGAVDEFIRHSITKMSYLHFPTNEQSRRRIIQLGEDPARVFNVGSLGIDNIKSLPLLSREEMGEALGLDLSGDYALVTYHPVTMGDDGGISDFGELLKAVERFHDMRFIFTKANADAGGRAVNAALDAFVKRRGNCVAFASLGSLRYLSAMKHACMVIGNSSSGLYETPSFGVPCVNIGDRQRGRLRAGNVVNCAAEAGAVESAINRALSGEFRAEAQLAVSPFGDGSTSGRIVSTLKDSLIGNDISLKKIFNFVDFGKE